MYTGHMHMYMCECRFILLSTSLKLILFCSCFAHARPLIFRLLSAPCLAKEMLGLQMHANSSTFSKIIIFCNLIAVPTLSFQSLHPVPPYPDSHLPLHPFSLEKKTIPWISTQHGLSSCSKNGYLSLD